MYGDSGLLETAVRGYNTTIVEKVLKQYFAHDRTLEFPRDKEAYNLAVASGHAEMVDIVAGYVPHVDEAVTSDGLKQAAEVGDIGMAKVVWDTFVDQQSKRAVGGMSVAIQVAASHDHFEMAEWCVRALHRSMDLCSQNVVNVIRHLCVWRPLVQWLHEERCFSRWGNWFPFVGAKEGNLEWVLYCLENGWEYEDGIMESAARGARLRVVRGLRERGCRWITEICG